jgi:hypothetical protein
MIMETICISLFKPILLKVKAIWEMSRPGPALAWFGDQNEPLPPEVVSLKLQPLVTPPPPGYILRCHHLPQFPVRHLCKNPTTCVIYTNSNFTTVVLLVQAVIVNLLQPFHHLYPKPKSRCKNTPARYYQCLLPLVFSIELMLSDPVEFVKKVII